MQKIVVKVGTSTLTQGNLKLSRRHMLSLVEQLVHLHECGKQLILVSSGAVAAGRDHLSMHEKNLAKQLCASTGQVILMQTWLELFSLFDLPIGQVLLNREDFTDSKKQCNARDVLESLLKHGIIPVINENDTMATQETRVGDNDNLAAHVAKLISADLVILLTDQEGLYTADPRVNPEAKLISTVSCIDGSILSFAGGSASSLGTGGMATKIEAAQTASQAGVRMVIASSSRPRVLIDIVEGKPMGTLFLEGGAHE